MEKNKEENDEDFFTYLKIIFIIIFIVSFMKINKGDIKSQIGNDIEINPNVEEKVKKNISIEERKEKEIYDYKEFLNFTQKPKNRNDPLINTIKEQIFKKFSESQPNKLGPGINIFLDMKFNFGNQLLIFNKLLFFCEIIGCKKILLEKDNNIYIKNNIYDKKYNLTIEVTEQLYDNIIFDNYKFQFDDNNEDNGNNENNENDNNEDNENKKANKEEKKDYYQLTSLDYYFYYNNYNIRIENRFNIFKDEILKNLPKIKTDKRDLYIHIRGSDIFRNKDPQFAPDYAQPPLCFYQKIINTNKFRNIHIISADKENPIVDILIKKYKNVKFKMDSIEKDISALAFAYNIVGSISSFLISSIKLNNNLINFWEYDIYLVSLGIPHLHHSLYQYKRGYTIYKMEPSKIYKNKMLIWQASKEQLKIMLKDKCPNNFTIIKPNV